MFPKIGSVAPSWASEREHNMVKVTAASLRLGLDNSGREATPSMVTVVRPYKACGLRQRSGVNREGVLVLGRNRRAIENLMLHYRCCYSRSRSEQNASEKLPTDDGCDQIPRVESSINRPVNLSSNKRWTGWPVLLRLSC